MSTVKRAGQLHNTGRLYDVNIYKKREGEQAPVLSFLLHPFLWVVDNKQAPCSSILSVWIGDTTGPALGSAGHLPSRRQPTAEYNAGSWQQHANIQQTSGLQIYSDVHWWRGCAAGQPLSLDDWLGCCWINLILNDRTKGAMARARTPYSAILRFHLKTNKLPNDEQL